MDVSIVSRLDDEYILSKRELTKIQEQIIIAKNKAVFGIIEPQDAVNKFDELRVLIDKHSILLERNINKLIAVTHNLDKQEELAKKTAEFEANVSNFKLMMSGIADDDQPTKPVSEFYSTVMMKSVLDLSNLKFAHREVVPFNETTYSSESYRYLPSELEIQNEMNVVNFNIGTVNLNPPEPIPPPVQSNKKKSKANRSPRDPKNKTVRKTATKDITSILNKTFQSLVINGQIATIRPSELYKLIEDTYKIPNVRDNYRSIVKNYLSSRMEEWAAVQEHIRDVLYIMMQNEVPRKKVYEQLADIDSSIQYEANYKQIIDEAHARYDDLLESGEEPRPRPNWPTPL